jgi:hypothetical protein
MTDAGEAPGLCASCGNAVAGGYCSRCGEEVLDPSKLTLRYFLSHTVVNEVLNLDGKIWRTLRLLLFRPAFLALEYAAGRRRLYVNPLRVLIVAIIVYVLATQSRGTGFTLGIGGFKLNIAPVPISSISIAGALDQVDRFEILEPMFVERFGPAENATPEQRDRFNRMLNGFATPLSFTTVFVMALFLYACFRRRRPLLVEHMVFSMHYFSAALLWLLVPLLAFALQLPRYSVAAALAVLLLVQLWQFTYLTMATRRFYFASDSRRFVAWPVSAIVAVVAYLLSSLFLTVVQFAGVAFAIATL